MKKVYSLYENNLILSFIIEVNISSYVIGAIKPKGGLGTGENVFLESVHI